MKKLLITGPESSGKSSLAKSLATHYQDIWVPEYARIWLEQHGPGYEEEDLIKIAKEQLAQEDALTRQSRKYLFCDTGMLVMKIWSQYKYGRCHPWIEKQWQERHYDYYLLCGVDIPWEPDPLREHPRQRKELYNLYKKELDIAGKPYLELSGKLEQRVAKVIDLLEK